MSEEIMKAETQNTSTVISTLQPKTAGDAAKLANAMNASLSLADLGDGAEIEVTDILVAPSKRESREHPGEFLDCESTYLISSDGTSYFSQSSGVARSAKNLAVMIDILRGETGAFKVRVVSQATQKGSVKALMVVNARG